MNKHRGFTLLEILIALFIFTILSIILVSALHNVINLQSGAEANAERLRKLQMALLVMSRNIEQTVDRPTLNTSGRQDASFIGTERGLTFTHAGVANPTGANMQSILRRVSYQWHDNALWQTTWGVLDLAPASLPHSQRLLSDVVKARFDYLDKNGRFQTNWPTEGQSTQPLPRAVRVTLTISTWGTLSQLYVISAEQSKASPSAAKS